MTNVSKDISKKPPTARVGAASCSINLGLRSQGGAFGALALAKDSKLAAAADFPPLV